MMGQLHRQTLLVLGFVLELLSLGAFFAFGEDYRASILGYMLVALVPIALACKGHLRPASLLTIWLLMASLMIGGEPWTAGGRQGLLQSSYSGFFLLPLLLSSFLASTAHLLGMAALLETFFALLVLQNRASMPDTHWDTNILFVIPLVTVVAWRAAAMYRAGIRSVELAAQAEARLIHAEAAREMAATAKQAAEGIAHDLVAPLGPIGGILGFIQEDLRNQDIPRALDALAVVQKSLDSLAAEGRSHVLEMRGLLSPSQPVNQIVERVLRRLPRSAVAITSDHRDVTAHPALPPPIVARALQNALDNALAFASSQVRLTCAAAGDQLTLVIEDDGPGVDPDVLAAGIQPGLSRRPGGVGIGLAGVKASLKAYDGAIRLENAICADRISGGRTVITFPVAGERCPVSGGERLG
ncbi:MAG TPA: sensor histidine kinase [Herpetosiphonaceae bacterium]|nr:sensor histidine kinase [Herpetosiphonaceae bacterium]